MRYGEGLDSRKGWWHPEGLAWVSLERSETYLQRSIILGFRREGEVGVEQKLRFVLVDRTLTS